MKVLIIGGHLSPALAVIEKLKNDEIFYVGRKYTFEEDKTLSLEYREISSLNVPFFELNTGRLQRKFTKHTIPSLLKLPIGLIESVKIVKRINPDVVLGFGGYLSLPVVLAARIFNIPVVIHEQTLEAGLANKISARFSQKICISWISSQKYFPQTKTVLTGNPIRQELILAANRGRADNKVFFIYITGGSSGSHAINLLVEQSLPGILKNFYVLHQTGDSQKYKDYDRLSRIKKSLDKKISKNYRIEKFLSFNESAKEIHKADLVIGRSGINTVTELIYLIKPALLIPFPYGQKNEQKKNADFLKSLGLAEVCDQNYLSAKDFIEKINIMRKNIDKYKLKEKFVMENSSDKIVEVLKDVSAKKTA